MLLSAVHDCQQYRNEMRRLGTILPPALNTSRVFGTPRARLSSEVDRRRDTGIGTGSLPWKTMILRGSGVSARANEAKHVHCALRNGRPMVDVKSTRCWTVETSKAQRIQYACHHSTLIIALQLLLGHSHSSPCGFVPPDNRMQFPPLRQSDIQSPNPNLRDISRSRLPTSIAIGE
jgi:hypothetical protein